MLQKKKGTYIQRTPPPMEKTKKKRKKKRGAAYRTRKLDSLMVSPPTLQRHELAEPLTLLFCTPPHFCRRHELAKSIHATFLYPTARLPPLFDAVVVITGGWCVAKRKEHTYRGHHLRCPSQSPQRSARGRTRLTTVTSISCRSL